MSAARPPHLVRMRLGAGGDRSNVEDRRGLITGGRLGLGGILVLGVLSLVFRQNFFDMLGDQGAATQAQGPQADQRRQAEAPLENVAVGTFNDAQSLWAKKVQGYRPAKLVLFWDQTQSGCGGAAAAMGPFYCPADERVYIDLGFYQELARRFGAPGDFAQAYVIAHEVGHHVQDLLGITGKVEQAHPARSFAAECALGEGGAAGRLPRRGLGPLRRAAPAARPGRRR